MEVEGPEGGEGGEAGGGLGGGGSGCGRALVKVAGERGRVGMQ